MAKKIIIGLNYFFDNQSNSGIVNYIYNLISALNSLEDGRKPAIVLFYSVNAPLDYIKAIQYPQIKYILFKANPSNRAIRIVNNLINRVFKKNIYLQLRYFNKINILYPYFELVDTNFEGFKGKIHWLVDFNNIGFPNHYADNGSHALRVQQLVTTSTDRVVLSSNTLLMELKKYYPEYKCDVRILKFASSIPSILKSDVLSVKMKHNLYEPFFMSPNQLWKHKNQAVILDALNIIKRKSGLKFKVLFSGSLEVNRGKGKYIDTLLEKVKEYQLDEYVLFLGVLDRLEQLQLMQGSIALLQPSLYEGWSTLVEEAKALNKFIILSDIPVHREQINENVVFFDPFDGEELAEKIIAQLQSPKILREIHYAENIRNYGKDILNALSW